ncbi:MAG: cation transporter [Flavisolibacter sp.]|jgi:copper chaperone CopZ|nr:cation transporter [Flavisolibacter sp.]
MKTILFAWLVILALPVNAQVTKVSLQASGLTCSMCSKAVKIALDEVAFVEKVMVDIKNQQYNISFKENAAIDLDALGKAVEDAGFSVAGLSVTAIVDQQKLNKDEHIKISEQYFHFLNAAGMEIGDTVRFKVVDKKFVSAKEFKKYSGLTKMSCVQTGKTSSCCTSEAVPAEARIFHAIL